MNTQVFMDWLEKKVLCNIPEGSLVVLDRATYHADLTNDSKPVASNLKKAEFAQWLVDKKINFKKLKTVEDFLTLNRVELAALCKKNKPKKVYVAQVLAKNAK